jgi:D-alanyl-D-alanine dipeptidase
MGGGFDEMTERSYPYFLALTSKERYVRDILRKGMESSDYTCYQLEWWHFDYKDNAHYPLTNKLLTEL